MPSVSDERRNFGLPPHRDVGYEGFENPLKEAEQ